MFKKFLNLNFTVTILIFINLALPVSGYCLNKGLLVLISHNKPPYTIVAQKIKQNFPNTRIYTLEKIKKVGTNYQDPIVVCLGSKVLRWAVHRPWQGTIVFSLVLELETEIKNSFFAKNNRLFGILLSFPPKRYLLWLKLLFPQIRSVGFLATSSTQQWVNDFLRDARFFNFDAKVFYLKNNKDLENVLRRISTQVKALIVFPDPLFINYLTFPKLVFFSIEQEIILISLSERLARAGALFSLGWDFNSIALQTVDLIKSLLNGDKIERKYFYPRKEIVYVNSKILKILNLKIPSHFYKKVILLGEGDKNDL